MFGQNNDNQQQNQGDQPFTAPASPQDETDNTSSAPVVTPNQPIGQTMFPATLPSQNDTLAENSQEQNEYSSNDDSSGADNSQYNETKPNPSFTEVNEDEPDDDLANIKKEAIEELSPLVKHLDQSPEDKFRTLMLLVQSTDDQELLKEAHATAKLITNDEEKAKALLAVINEIDYFRQASKKQ